MKKTMFAAAGLAVMFMFGACGGEAAKAEKLVDKMCACKDMECVEKLEKEMREIDESKLSDKEKEKLGKKAMECAMKMSTEGMGGDEGGDGE